MGSFFNLLKENSMNVCLKSDMGLKKKLLASSLAWKISLSSGQSETYSHSVPSGEEWESGYSMLSNTTG